MNALKAGLFSAVLTTFIVEVYGRLQEDSTDASAQILRRISMQLQNIPQSELEPLPPRFNPSGTIVAVNVLWFLSLLLSLFAALFAFFAKQWLYVYSKWSEGARPGRDMLLLRNFYRNGFEKWHLTDVIDTLPVLLQLALLLFAIGLVAYLWILNIAVAIVASVAVLTMICMATVTIALPIFYADCPYKSPLGAFLWLLKERAWSKAAPRSSSSVWTRFASWRERDLAFQTTLRPKDPVDRIMQAVGIILNIPLKDVQKDLKADNLNGSFTASRMNELPPAVSRLFRDLIIPSAIDKQAADYWPTHERASLLLRFVDYLTRHPVDMKPLEAMGDLLKVVEHALMTLTSRAYETELFKIFAEAYESFSTHLNHGRWIRYPDVFSN
jgi:hypothetical protein